MENNGNQTLALFENHYHDIVGWLRNQGAGDNAEDLATEAFVRCWNIEQRTGQRITKGYLYCAAQSVWVSWIRSTAADKERTKRWVDQHQPSISEQPSFEEASEILAELSPKQIFIAQHRAQNYSYSEIAERYQDEFGVKITPEACKRALFSARYRLRKKYGNSSAFR